MATLGPRQEMPEKVWTRKLAIAWDASWQALSIPARRAFLEKTKGPSQGVAVARITTPSESIPPDILAELVKAHLVMVEPGTVRKGGRVVVPSALYDFAKRVRTLHQYHLLGPSDVDHLARFCRFCFYHGGELEMIRVLHAAKIEDPCRLEDLLERYVTSGRWPAWASADTKLPLAAKLVAALVKSPTPIPLAKLAAAVPGPAAEVETTLAALLQRVAVFEDLDPVTFEIVVGLPPVVRERIEAATQTRSRPPLVEVKSPRQVGPHAGLLGADLRTFLLEVIAQSPRLRQDGALFAVEEPRFLAALPAWPDWFIKTSGATPEARLIQAHDWAAAFRFVEQFKGDDEDRTRLRLSTRGQSWLASDVEDQYVLIYDALRTYPTRKSSSYYHYDEPTHGDAQFLGVSAVVRPQRKSSRSYWSDYHDDLKPEDRQALRDALHKALGALPLNRFVTVDSALAHLTFGAHNPLLLGKLDPSAVSIQLAQTRVPQLPDRVEAAGRDLLRTFLVRRILPFDAMQLAIDDQHRLCVSRLPRLDGYFGRKYKADPSAGKAESRVIVQPDFSVMVIGLDPGPAVALSPFCDRTQGQAGQGAMVFKLTRESVVRAVAGGMKPAEVLNRLTKHASVAVPANVLAEVREWTQWTRLVNVRTALVVRCPDRETAARVLAALGKRGEPLGETLVGVDADRLNAADRTRLQSHGILITKADIRVAAKPAEVATDKSPPAGPKKRGRPRKVR